MSTGGAGHAHTFDPISGWCSRCNLREDGRLLGRGGDIIHQGQGYTSQQLDALRVKIGAA